MKRTKKLALKTETVRPLSGEELQAVNGGGYYYANTDYCQQGGGGNIVSTEDPNRAEYNGAEQIRR